MNAVQQTTVDNLRRDILLHDGLGERFVSEYEYKQFEVTETKDTGTVFVYSEVGHKNDEHTLGSVLCRTIRHLAIGHKGGVRLLNPRGRNSYITGYARAIYWTTK